MRICWSILLLLGLSACAACGSTPYELDRTAAVQFPSLHILGTLYLNGMTVDDIQVGGLSGLGWDEDEGRLYAVADTAKLFYFIPRFKEGRLTDVEAKAAYALRGPDGSKLRGRYRDAEGLVVLNGDNGIRGDSELLISFERKPRIERYRPDGRWLARETLPEVLKDRAAYRDNNKMLEAVAWRQGVLTTPEWPLRAEPDHDLVIYGAEGERWRLKQAPARNSAVVALESLPDGSLLIMERAFTAPVFLIITLRRFFPESGATATIATLNNSKGWRLDNFEGLTRYRENTFFMVSDNNFSAAQKTLLTYFELP